MGEAVAEGEQPNQRSGGSDRHFHVEGQQKPQHRDGSSDPVFDKARGLGVETERRAQNHHADEDRRNDETGAAGKLSGPIAGGDHGQQMVCAGEGMDEAVRESRRMEAGMGGSRKGEGGERGRKRGGFQQCLHVILPCGRWPSASRSFACRYRWRAAVRPFRPPRGGGRARPIVRG